MARAQTKKALLELAQSNFEKLWQLINSMREEVLNTEFDFSDDLKKKEAHWKRDKNLRDILVHLYEWQQLLLNWIHSNSAGKESSFLPEPYNWKTYAQMNIAFWKKHQNTTTEEAKKMLKTSHQAAFALVQSFSDEELFTKQFFNWTGTTSLGSYCASAMPSHYDWAIKKLHAHAKRFS